MILKDPIAIDAAERFQRRVDALRAEYPGLADVGAGSTFPLRGNYFALLAQAMEVTLVPMVDPIREVECGHPSLDTMHGGFPWVCDHHPWPKAADGGCLAPLMQIRLADLAPDVQVEFPDLLVQVWADEWDTHVRTVTIQHASTCDCPRAREPYVGRLIWFRSRTEVARADWAREGVEDPKLNGPDTIVGFQLGDLHLGGVSILPQVIKDGAGISFMEDFVSFDAAPQDALSKVCLQRQAEFGAALEQLSELQLEPLPTLGKGSSRHRSDLRVGEFFKWPDLPHEDISDDVVDGWRPLFCCSERDNGSFVMDDLVLYLAYRCIDEKFEFSAMIFGTR